jgi:hypothetical protein
LQAVLGAVTNVNATEARHPFRIKALNRDFNIERDFGNDEEFIRKGSYREGVSILP